MSIRFASALYYTTLGLIGILLVSPEVSVATARAFSRDSWYSAYLLRIGIFTVSDYIIIFLAALCFTLFSRKGAIRIGVLAPIMLIYIVYFAVGLVYNLLIYFELKALMYDLKTILYFFIPYLILSNSRFFIKISLSHLLTLIAILHGVGSALDYFINTVENVRFEYSKALGVPALLYFVPFPIALALFHLEIQKRRVPILSGPLIAYILYTDVVLLKLSNLYQAAVVGGIYISMVGLALCKRHSPSLMIMLYIIGFILMPTLILIIGAQGSLKADGLLIRNLEIKSFVLNVSNNIPLLIGKGLGATWAPISHDVIPGMEYASSFHFLESDVKFIWHNTIAGHLYKFGIVGFLVIILFYYKLLGAIFSHNRPETVVSERTALALLAVGYCLLISIGPGELKYGVIAGVILAYMNKSLRDC